MKNNKYKINLKGLLLGLGGAVSVIAPLATVISCGGSNEQPKTIDTSSINLGIKVDDTNIKALPQNLTPYSVSELFADATRYGDTSMWNRGVAYHSLGSTVSFIKGLAEAYGWDRQDYASKNGITVIDSTNENKNDIVATTDSKFLEIEALRDMKPKSSPLTDAQKRDLYFEAGDDGAWNNYDLVNLENTKFSHTSSGSGAHVFSDLSDTTGKTKVNVRFSGAGGEYFADIKNPGNTLVQVHDTTNKISRVVSLKNAFDAFPILKDDQLHDDIAPYAKALIEKFLLMYKDNKGMASGRISSETLNQIEYLIEKNTIADPNNPNQKVFSIDDTIFNQKLKMLNNGSTHWLAVKTFFRGLDKSFVSGGFETYNNYGSKSQDNVWKAGSGFLAVNIDALKGVKDMKDIMGLTEWAHWNQSYSSLGRMNFVAGKTLEENDAFNNYTDDRKALLSDLISKNQKYLLADSVNSLWTTFDTNGKTYSEVSQVILKHMLLEKEMKYVMAEANGKWQAVANVDSKTMEEIQDIVAKNKVLELFDAKYLVGIDIASKSAQEIQELAFWNKYKDHNQALISAALTQLSLQPSDLDSHKAEIRAIVDPQLTADLSFLQALIDANRSNNATKVANNYLSGTDANLTKLIAGSTVVKGNDPLIGALESAPIKAGIIAELSKQGHTLFSTGNYALEKDARIKVVSFTPDSISISLELDTKTVDGSKHTSTQQIILYRK